MFTVNQNKGWFAITMAIIVYLGAASTANAAREQAKLTALDGAAGKCFGTSVSISGDYCIVGASKDDDKGENSGSAYIFKRSFAIGWFQQAKLTAADGKPNNSFGGSVSISGDYCIVGAYDDANKGKNSGSAYIFKRSGASWTQEAKLTAADGAAGDMFGASVSISGDYCIVGAHWDADKGKNSGSAYIFKRNGTSWTEQAKLTASDGDGLHYFGCSVSISGDYCIVGALGDDDKGINSGSAYMFKRSAKSWLQQAKLTAADGKPDNYFGCSVSISGDYCIVGAYFADGNAFSSGSAYIFKRSSTSWTQKAKLNASDGKTKDYLGNSVSISGDYCIVGALSDDDKGENSGSAYIFKRSGTSWLQQAKLTASDGKAWDSFGGSVSISGDYCIVGAYFYGSGSAYIYSIGTVEPGPKGQPAVKTGEKRDYIDKTGKYVIRPQFDNAWSFSDGLAAVKTGGKYGYIYKTGKYVIEPQLDWAESFSKGLAIVQTGGLLSSAVPAQFEDGVLTLEFGASAQMQKRMCESNGRGEQIQALLSEQLSMPVRLVFETAAEQQTEAVPDANQPKTSGQRRNELINDPAVKTVLMGLDATITGIEEDQ